MHNAWKKYQEMLTLNEAMSTRMTVVLSIEYLHTVNYGERHYTVCLLERKCFCGRFQVDELLCIHAWAVLKSKFLMLEDYCSNYYKPNSVVMTYDVPVIPLPDRNDWNIPAHVAEEVVLPPKWKRPPEGQRRSAINLSVNCCSRKINIHIAYVGKEDITNERVEMLHQHLQLPRYIYSNIYS
ncbi:uncharacterized protein LOC142181955 [Nicotiana tabacum]|uniref:Uncharacterized protein LOC142181955 n=1 Tax=Nicotiana tabacum TaxID=4097 RepID=A0AC58UQK3_TOBAC